MLPTRLRTVSCAGFAELAGEDERAQEAATAAGWDLLVVDEAHHLVWQSEHASDEYALVEQLAAITPAYY